MHAHLKGESGFFCGHLDFPTLTLPIKAEIMNSLLKKLIRQGLNDEVLIEKNVRDLKYLQERFEAGEKIFVIDSENGNYPGYPFMYLSFTGNPHWEDKRANFIRNFELPERSLMPLYFEQNHIPDNGIDTAIKYYKFIEKFIHKENERKRFTGALSILSIPQVLINFPTNELKQTLSEYLEFDFRDLKSKTPTFMRCEGNPFILLNDGLKCHDRVLFKNTKIGYTLTILDLTKSKQLRNHITTFERNSLIDVLDTKGLIALSFRNNLLHIKENVSNINKRLFNIGERQLKKSVVISRIDLNLYDPNVPEVITWLEDRSLFIATQALQSLIAAIKSESGIEITIFNKFKFFQLISLSLTPEIQNILLDELMNGTNGIIDEFRGVRDYDLKEESINQVESLLQEILSKILKLCQSQIRLDLFDLIVVPYFILSNSQFLLRLPQKLVSKFCGWDTISNVNDRILILDYLDLDRPLNIFNVQRSFQKAQIFFIASFFKNYYLKNKAKLFENILQSYDTNYYPLRSPLLAFEQNSKNLIERNLQLKEFKNYVIVDAIEINDDGWDIESTQQKFEIITDKGRGVAYGSDKVLSKDIYGWKIVTYQSLFEKMQLQKYAAPQIVDHSQIKELLSKGKKIKIHSWRKDLRRKVDEVGLLDAYQTLVKYSQEFRGEMVSLSWFEQDWLSLDDSDSSIPKSRANLLAIGKFIPLTEEVLLSIVRTNLLQRLDTAEVNKSILHLLRDLLELISNQLNRPDLETITEVFTNSPSYQNSRDIFAQYISASNDLESINREVKNFFKDCITKIEHKRIKQIINL